MFSCGLLTVPKRHKHVAISVNSFHIPISKPRQSLSMPLYPFTLPRQHKRFTRSNHPRVRTVSTDNSTIRRSDWWTGNVTCCWSTVAYTYHGRTTGIEQRTETAKFAGIGGGGQSFTGASGVAGDDIGLLDWCSLIWEC